MTPPTLYVLIGPPGAGKSTFAARHTVRTGCALVSSDAHRAECSPHHDENDQDETVIAEAVRVCDAKIIAHLAAGRSVLVDATNAIREHRLPLLGFARSFRALSAALVLLPPLSVCLSRNALRDGARSESGFARRVPSPFIEAAHAEITADLPSLPAEGWHQITRVEDFEP